MKSLITVLLFSINSLFCSGLNAQEFDIKYFQNNTEIYFSFNISDRNELLYLTSIISIDNVIGLKVFAYANENEFKQFLNLGYEFDVLIHPGRRISPEMSDNVESITDWNVYPTYEAYVNMMNNYASDYPDICQIVDAGNTVQGRKILFAKISSNVSVKEAKPQFMFTSSMHGDELTGYVLMLRLIDSLLTSYGTDPRLTSLINNVEIWINPLANPDGTYRSGNNTVSGATRYNFNNVDLNRNFPDPVNGVNPNQQQETTVFRNLQEANNFQLVANFHGGAEVVNYPWDRWANTGNGSRVHADQSWYQFISQLYADTCQQYSPSGYMSGFDDGITNGGDWYVITGGRQDYTNFYRWGREVTIEISNTKLPAASLLPGYWEYNKRSFLTYMESVLYGVKGLVTDTVGTPVKAKITINGHDVDNSEVWSDTTTGFYLRMLSPGTYTVKFEAFEHYDTTITNVVLASYFSETELNVQLRPLVPVPVELTSFDASIAGNSVSLQWRTVSEINNKGFEVERKLNEGSKNLDNGWSNIGYITGKGTTTEMTNYFFRDLNLNAGKYDYRIKQIDFDGSFQYYNLVKSIEIGLPDRIELSQNYPNPFNPSTTINFNIKEKSSVKMTLMNIIGEEVAILLNEEKVPGFYQLEFDAATLPSGIYFYRLQTEHFQETKKMILMK
jgi:hypothetical protein